MYIDDDEKLYGMSLRTVNTLICIENRLKKSVAIFSKEWVRKKEKEG